MHIHMLHTDLYMHILEIFKNTQDIFSEYSIIELWKQIQATFDMNLLLSLLGI